ncbi:HTH domain-containing protein [Flavihumibacter petaseus]|uniref:Putative DNA-binding protein n=1 Tax=Flavihumibacter petaseus NBRC 106054 TaxID=1220578 RepID=A0A0E9MWT3_9BACT|nr:helix-turn-helix domain-containing protein [Flavihumibacter petaseus]GAO41958.1 putative DNA-binding protein [Flavihumibacter petaseus NBRC 106054]
MAKHVIDRLDRLDNLIRTKSTGTPQDLANKLNISRSTLYEYIGLLKSMGAPISFCRRRNSFYYEVEGKFHFNFKAS